MTVQNPIHPDPSPRFAAALASALPLAADRIRHDEPMAAHTTFRIGGPADFYFEPASITEIQAVLLAARQSDCPVTLLGNGSNILVADRGIRGCVISLGQPFAAIHREGNDLIAQAGAKLSSVAAFAARENLGGLAFASGIPGTLGGAVMMNAGAYDHCMADVVIESGYITEDYREQSVHGEALEFGYRHSCFKDTSRIVTSARIRLYPQDSEQIWEEINGLAARRRLSQPLEWPSAGSAFKRPPGHYAGKLIADCGLKGYRIGGAEVSEKHAGFIINRGHATAADVRQLFKHIQTEVQRQFGVLLEPEVRFVGAFD